jgi:cell fate (sporulation/competence/biofilm development) regulator YlbF (YheA/YmcA/DUF963 family)
LSASRKDMIRALFRIQRKCVVWRYNVEAKPMSILIDEIETIVEEALFHDYS